MDGRLQNENRILKRILKWVDEKPGHLEEGFCCDFHIDQWCKTESKADWLDVGMKMYALLKNNIGKSYPHLKVMIAFCLSVTYQPKIPKTLSRRNFRERNNTPPIIYLYSDKLDEKDLLLGNLTFLPEVSEKFRLKAYYQEIKEDVYYRAIFMFK